MEDQTARSPAQSPATALAVLRNDFDHLSGQVVKNTTAVEAATAIIGELRGLIIQNAQRFDNQIARQIEHETDVKGRLDAHERTLQAHEKAIRDKLSLSGILGSPPSLAAAIALAIALLQFFGVHPLHP